MHRAARPPPDAVDSAMSVAVRLLGRFEVRIDGRPVARPGAKTCALLGYLAARAAWVERSEVVALLYPEVGTRQARGSLRQLLHNARPYAPHLERDGSRLRWRPDCDLDRFVAAADRGDAQAALAAWGGELLEDLPPLDEAPFLEWLDLERERLGGVWRSVALDEAERLRAGERPAEAAELLRRVVAADPLDEDALARLMEALAAAGRTPQALNAYRRFSERLQREVDLPPAPETRDLADRLREGVRSTDAPARGGTLRANPAPIPRARHELIGRDGDLAALDRVFGAGARWATLTGLGGSGKSRLALAYTARAATIHAVAWADGGRARDAAGLQRELRRAFGLDERADAPLTRGLAALGEGPVLLVVDDPADPDTALGVLAHLLDAGPPGLRLLVTARGELGHPDEQVVPLGGLSSRAGADLLRTLVGGAGPPSGAHRRAAERIARATGGLPLALRLAAGWAELMPLEQLADRVERSTDALTDATGEAGLAQVLDETLASLAGADRAAFARLGVFAAPFAATAAEAVGVALPALLRLRRRGLVERHGDDRLSLHPLLAERAAAELLGLPESDTLLRAHAEHHLGTVAEAGLSDERRPRALDRLDAMRDDLQRAWAWAVEAGRHDLLDAALPNWTTWHVAATRHEELATSVAAATPDGPPLRRARYRLAAVSRRRDEASRAEVETCLTVFEREEAWLEAAQALENLAIRSVGGGAFEQAARLADRGLAAAERAGAPSLRVSLLNVRASPAIAVRDHAKAEELYRTAISGAEDDPLAADRARGNLADLCVALGRPREAVALTRASLTLARARHDPEYALRRRHVLARALYAAGDDAEAEALLRRQLDDLAGADLDRVLMETLRWLAAKHLVRLLASSDRSDEAEGLWRRASPPSQGRAWRRPSWLATGGWLALQAGDVVRADAHLTEALDAFDALPVTPAVDETAARVEALLDGTTSALAAGRLEVARSRCVRGLDGALDAASPPLLLAALLAAARVAQHAGRTRRACLLVARVSADPRCHTETRRAAHDLAARAALVVPDVAPVSDARLGRLARSALKRMS